MIKSFIKGLFCNHTYFAIGGIYGDQIIDYGWKRSIWKCHKCGNIQCRDNLKGIDL